MRDHHFQLGKALHHRKADQRGGNEHVVIEPAGENRGDRMADRRGRKEGKMRQAVATTGSRTAAGIAHQGVLIQPIFDLFNKRAV